MRVPTNSVINCEFIAIFFDTIYEIIFSLLNRKHNPLLASIYFQLNLYNRIRKMI